MKNKITILYVPCPDEKTGKKISSILLKEKLAACVQSFPSKSLYPWNGKIEQSNEIVLLVKTINKKYSKAKMIIKENHSYEIPCIIHYEVSINKEYYNWMKEVLN